MRHSLALFLLLTLTACSMFDPLPDGSAQTKYLSVEENYTQAKAELNDGNYESAIKLYETLQSRYPYGRYAQQALLEVAYAYYRQGEAESSVSAADRFIKQYPNNPHVDYAYYVKGLANFNGEINLLKSVGGQDPTERDPKASQDSFAAFKDLVIRFPNSKYTPDSRLRMQYLVNSLAKYELHVASYYLRRGAHIAAANRAQGVLTQYPNSSSTRDALEILVQAYDAMGMTDLRDDARRVLAKNSGMTAHPSDGKEATTGEANSGEILVANLEISFCPSCGAAVELRCPDDDNRLRHICTACGTIHYQNPRMVIGSIPEWEDKILLCRRAIEPRHGLWTLPGGFMENGETTAEAAIRETLEEANAHISIGDLYSMYSLPYINQVHLLFRARLLDLNFGPGAESLEVKLFAENEIPWDEIAFRPVKFSLEHYFADRQKGHFVFHMGELATPLRTTCADLPESAKTHIIQAGF